MKYNVLYHPLLLKEDLPKIPKNIKESIKKAIEERLLTEPFLYGEPLRQSLKGHRKLRAGDYRIIYRVKQNTLIVLKIGPRKEVYLKIFPRLSS